MKLNIWRQKSNMKVVGFDFGTTNSLIASIQGGRAINYLDDEGLPVPSVVCYEGASKIVGRGAKERLAEAGLGIKGNVVRSPKFLLGQESVFIEGVERSPVDIVSDVVGYVAQQATESRRGLELGQVDKAVVTIPVDMEGHKRAALRDAFRSAGINIVHFIHEPLAALYGFFRAQRDLEQALRQYDSKLILVFDWGGGTLDLTLCHLSEGMLVQIRNDGTDEVGGDAFDDLLRNEMIKRVMEQRGYDETVKHYPDAMSRLLHRCERAKIDLSTREKVELYVDSFFRDVADDDLDYSLTRNDLEEIVLPLLDKGLKRISKLLDSADVSPAQVFACIATGGMANMPAIKSRLHEWFGAQRVHVSDRSGTLIAEGAAWLAHDQVQLHLAKNVELLLARNSHMALVPSGTAMPSEGELMKDDFHLYCSDPRDGHAKFQIETPIRSGKKILPNDNRHPLATLVVPVDSKAKPFHERLEMEVRIDDNLILHISAKSLNIQGSDATEIHNLEFGLLISSKLTSSIDSLDFEGKTRGQLKSDKGSLVMRSNIANSKDEFLVPGELLYTYNRHYFDVRLNPPQIQVEERLYYQPCSICGRISNDPLCKCASQLSY
jgi:actin-like ATPase involved in cell morphogenesis